MKKFLLLFVLSVPFLVWAQSTIAVEQSAQTFSRGEQPSYRVLIPGGKLKDVSNDWNKYLKTKSKGKVEELNGEFVIYGAVNKNVAADGFNVFSKLLETTEGVQLTAWFMRSDSTFMSWKTDENQSKAVEKYMSDFAAAEYRDVVGTELKGEQKKLDELEKELKGFINDEEKSSKNINESERTIERTKTEIKTNEGDQKLKNDQVTKQKAVVESLKATPGDAYKEADKTLKGFENELKKLINENEKMHKQIDKAEKDIREERRNIDKSRQDQNAKRADIDKQRAVVKQVQEKLDGIK